MIQHSDNNAPKSATAESRFFKNLIGNLPGFIYRCKNDPNWSMEYISENFSEITGYFPGEVLHNRKVSFTELIVEEDREMVMIEVEKALKNKSRFNIEYRIKKSDNAEIWVLERGKGIIENGALNKIEGYIEEITDRKQREQQIESLSENLKITLSSIGDAVIATDIQGNVVRMNPVAEKLTGWQLDEAMGLPLEDVFQIQNAHTHENVENPVKKVLQTGKIVGLANHTQLISKSGNIYQIADSGSPIKDASGRLQGVVLVFRDVTESYFHRERLMVKSFGIDNAQLGIYQIDESGMIKYANQEACRMLGYNQKELTSMSLFNIDTSFDTETFRQHRADAREKRQKTINTYHKRKDSVNIPVEVNVSYFNYEGTDYSFSFVKDMTERQRYENQIRESEKRFHTLAESIPAGVLVADRKQQVQFINQRFTEMFGYTPEEITNLESWWSRAYPDPNTRRVIQQQWKEVMDKARKTNVLIEPLEADVTCQNGNTIPVEFRMASVGDTDFILFTDISARKEAEKQLRKSEKNYKYLFENNPNPMWIYDLDTARFLAVNNTAMEKYGYSREEFLNMTLYDIHPSRETEKLKQNIEQSKNRFQTTGPWVHRLKSGQEILVEIRSYYQTFKDRETHMMIANDITEKEKALSQIRLLSRSVEQSPVGILITNHNGEIEYANSAFVNLTGYTLEQIRGKNPRILNSGYHSEAFYHNLWETILAGKNWSGEIRNKKKNGELIWEDVSISPIITPQGQISHFVSVREDITEKKKMMLDLIKAKEKAEESDRLKSAFLANMSHEIRTPMNGILGFIDVLQNENVTRAQRNHYMSIVRKGGNRLLDTINDIIEISKIEAGQISLNKTSLYVPEILSYFRDFYSTESEKKGIDFRINNQAGTKANVIVSDKTKLESILNNFIKNAFKFTAKGFIELGVYTEPGKIVFYVKDTGVGIPKNRKEAIFQRFVQADLEITRPHEGSGLGLSIAQGYATMLGGQIRVESEVGKGSSFYFSLPFKTPAQENTTTSQATQASKKNNQGDDQLILIAEDEEHSYLFLKIVLTNNNFRVIWARNGAEAVKYLQENHDIALVLMDLKMPYTDGLEATRQIRQFNPDIPIIAQTAYALSGDRLKALRAGCNAYISKPIKKDKLLSVIHEHLG